MMSKILALLSVLSIASAAPLATCPGYRVTNVQSGDSYLVADLTLAGNKCNIYSEDITNLRLTVEYQTGKTLSLLLASPSPQYFDPNPTRSNTTYHHRHPSPRLNRRPREERLPNPRQHPPPPHLSEFQLPNHRSALFLRSQPLLLQSHTRQHRRRPLRHFSLTSDL